jgi:hypothetical protein
MNPPPKKKRAPRRRRPFARALDAIVECKACGAGAFEACKGEELGLGVIHIGRRIASLLKTRGASMAEMQEIGELARMELDRRWELGDRAARSRKVTTRGEIDTRVKTRT